jgi:hypothetical protein
MCTQVEGRMRLTPIHKRRLADKKKNMVRYFLIRPHTSSNHLELKKYVLFYLIRTSEIFARKQVAARPYMKLDKCML